MKVNFADQDLKNLDGSPLMMGSNACPMCGRPEDRKPATLRAVCADALVTQFRAEDKLPGEDKVKRYALAIKITNQDEVDLSIEEAHLIRKLVNWLFGPLFVGPVWALVDVKEEDGG